MPAADPSEALDGAARALHAGVHDIEEAWMLTVSAVLATLAAGVGSTHVSRDAVARAVQALGDVLRRKLSG
jgi:hypothetical protein